MSTNTVIGMTTSKECANGSSSDLTSATSMIPPPQVDFACGGAPRCGKSISVLISHLESRREMVYYFFCKQNDENKDNSLSILRTLLW